MKQEKGSALVMTVMLVAVIGVIAVGTSAAVNHNYKLKQHTLSSEKINYTATSAAEYSHSYITKLLNTTFTYTMYFNQYNKDSDNWNGLREDDKARPGNFCTEPGNFTTKGAGPDVLDGYNGITYEFGQPVDDEHPERVRPQEYSYENKSDYNAAMDEWKKELKKRATEKFNAHLEDKLCDGKSSPPAVDTRKCKSITLHKDLQDSMDAMLVEMNGDFTTGTATKVSPINSIKVSLPDFDANASKAKKDFIDDGYLHVKFDIDMLDQIVHQSVKFKWDMDTIINTFCNVYASSGTFQDRIEVKVYYDKPEVEYK